MRRAPDRAGGEERFLRGATKRQAILARSRDLLMRLIRVAGYKSAEMDRLIGKKRGFTIHLCRQREGLPLAELCQILGVLGVRREDFFEAVLRGPDAADSTPGRSVDLQTYRLLQKEPPKQPAPPAVVQGSVPSAEGPAESERDLAARLGRIKALLDRRILDLIERSLGEPAAPPPESFDLAPVLAQGGEAP